ncbi:MAG: Flp family type IVb pilin [Chloroflexi bacterium]|nr:MAG: Flp family type IVb pilin [Chloroflexota bacterium]
MIDSFLGREDEGQGLVEYALIIALVAVVCAAALTTLQGDIDGVFADIGGSL